ncbi:hypothetical protein BUALT_Bualt19G0033300 [Buddleja alternifolia]|uniref:40S ribosomal protein S16 n=1 Tax=Buddleja alternifolia TaxID=168488 RepID=A0AAV6W1W3_9LAMI|nr:hypothetical protein BUALT_Bualt19G0033300 [Buddleja alternifolia]
MKPSVAPKPFSAAERERESQRERNATTTATMATPPESVQCFGRKKTAVAVTHCRHGRGLIKINGVPIELVQPEILRYKAFEPILLLGRHRFTSVDMRIHVKGGAGAAGREEWYGAKLTNIFSTEFEIETANGKRQKKYKQVCCAYTYMGMLLGDFLGIRMGKLIGVYDYLLIDVLGLGKLKIRGIDYIDDNPYGDLNVDVHGFLSFLSVPFSFKVALDLGGGRASGGLSPLGLENTQLSTTPQDYATLRAATPLDPSKHRGEQLQRSRHPARALIHGARHPWNSTNPLGVATPSNPYGSPCTTSWVTPWRDLRIPLEAEVLRGHHPRGLTRRDWFRKPLEPDTLLGRHLRDLQTPRTAATLGTYKPLGLPPSRWLGMPQAPLETATPGKLPLFGVADPRPKKFPKTAIPRGSNTSRGRHLCAKQTPRGMPFSGFRQSTRLQLDLSTF